MSTQVDERLAMEGGAPVRTAPFGPSHEYGERELALLREMLEKNDLGRGRTVEFEQAFAAAHQRKHAVSCISGTASVHIAVAAINPEPGDEFITTPLSSAGTFLGVVMHGAVPVFADVDPETYCLDPKDVEAKITPRTRGIIPVHLFGNPCEMDGLIRVARKHHLHLIEDCCQAHFSEYQGRRVGTMGDMACFSFGGKHMSAGGGGIMLTDHDGLAWRGRMFHDAALPRDGGPYANQFLATNYKMPGIVAAVLLGQLERLDGYVTRKTWAAQRLNDLLADVEEIHPQAVRPGNRNTYWVYGFRVDVAKLGIEIETFAKALQKEGVPPVSAPYGGTRPFGPLYRIPMLARPATFGSSRFPFDYQRTEPVDYTKVYLPHAEAVYRDSCAMVWLPSLTETDIEDIAAAIRKVVTAYLRKR